MPLRAQNEFVTAAFSRTSPMKAVPSIYIEGERRKVSRLPDGEGNKEMRRTPLETWYPLFILILILNLA